MTEALTTAQLTENLRAFYRDHGRVAASYEDFREMVLAEQGGNGLPDDAVTETSLRFHLSLMMEHSIANSIHDVSRMFLKYGFLMYYIAPLRQAMPAMQRVELVQIGDIARVPGPEKLWAVADTATDVLVLTHGVFPDPLISVILERPKPAAE